MRASLLLDVVFGASLLRLSGVMLLLKLCLLGLVTRDAGVYAADRTSNSIGGARGQVTELALGLLLLSSQVLFTACLLQTLQ
jgi:hypothetical protein